MNKNMHWKQLKSTVIFEHQRISIIEDEVELPDGTITQYIKFGGGGQGVTILALKENEILLQQEYSYPVDEVLYQFPGGGIKKNESPEQAAVRELIEESGLIANKVLSLGWYYPNNRRSDAKMHVVLMENFIKTEKKGGDKEENILSEWVSEIRLNEMICKGEIVNYSVLAAWALYKCK
jgi:8-oxo-dGTP pyrophosphatase MutT (NUDIX family)